MSCTGPSATTEPRSDVCEFRASAAADTVTVSWTALSCRETSTLTVWPTGNVISWMAALAKPDCSTLSVYRAGLSDGNL